MVYKTEYIAIKLTPEQKKELQEKAEREKLSVSEYVRKKIFKK